MSMRHPELLVATATTPLIAKNVTRRAVSTAVIVIAMTKQITTDTAVLNTVANAALFAELATALFEVEGSSEAVAPRALEWLVGIGAFHDAAVRRNVVVHEVLSMTSPTQRAQQDERSSPTLLASLLFVARRFNELRTPRPGAPAPKIDKAYRQLDSELSAEDERMFIRVLVSGLGLFPSGTLVELTTGEIAVVQGIPSFAIDFARPPVRVLTDSDHETLDKPQLVDLASSDDSGARRSIQRAVSGSSTH